MAEGGENPFDPIPGDGEGGEEVPMHRFDRNEDSRYILDREDETDFGGGDLALERSKLQEKYERTKDKDEETQGLLTRSPAEIKSDIMNNARRDVKKKRYPNVDLTRLNIDDKGRIIVSGLQPKNKWTNLYKLYKSDGETIQKYLPNAVKVALGDTAVEIMEKNEMEIEENESRIRDISTEKILMKDQDR